MADPQSSKSTGPALPQFDENKVYLVSGKSLRAIVAAIKSNRPRVVSDGGLKIASQSDQGSYLALDAGELSLSVCINGNAQTKTFYVKK